MSKTQVGCIPREFRDGVNAVYSSGLTCAPLRDAGRPEMWFAQLTVPALSQPRLADAFILQRACFGLLQ